MKNSIVSKALFATMLAASSAAALAVTQMPVDESVSQGSGIVKPSQAVGAIKANYGFTHFENDGGLAVCDAQSNWSAECVKYVTPADFIKHRFPKREYVGFQVFVLKDGPQLYLYYR